MNNKIIVETDKIEKNHINDNLKNTDTLKLVVITNNHRHSVKEIIFKELICI